MARLTRRDMMKGALATGAFGLLAPAFGLSRAFAAETLTATHFGGPYQVLSEIIAAPFAEAGLGEVTYDVAFSGAAIGSMQTQKANPPFDVTMLSRSFAIRAQNAGLLARLEPGDITDTSGLIAEAVPAGGWGAAMILDTFDLMIDNKVITEPLTSWLDLWRPDLAGKILLPAASNPGTVFFIACLARAISGGEALTPEAVDEAFEKLTALKPSVRSFYADGTQATQLIERGEISVAPQFGIRIANQTRTAPNIVKVTPDEGIVAIPYDLCIPVNSQKIDLAKTYINFALTQKVQSGLAASLLATPVREDAEIAADVAPLVTTDFSKIWFADEEFLAANQKTWLDRYTREIQS